jgi:hypothetical protein
MKGKSARAKKMRLEGSGLAEMRGRRRMDADGIVNRLN